MATEEVIKGHVKAISVKNKSFLLAEPEEWFKLGTSTDVPVDKLKKDMQVEFIVGLSADRNGNPVKWANKLILKATPTPSQNTCERAQEPPPIGKFESKLDMSRNDFNIMYGMCVNNAVNRRNALVGTEGPYEWDTALNEAEELMRKVYARRAKLWQRAQERQKADAKEERARHNRQ